MGHLSQLVLLASIVASCVSSIDSANIPVPEPPVEPSRSEFSDFPIEFMEKLISSMTPEQRKRLQEPIYPDTSYVHRTGDTDNMPCRGKTNNQNYLDVTATDKERYFVVNLPTEKYQPVVHYVCNVTRGNTSCTPARRERLFNTNDYCCQPVKATSYLTVIPKPISSFTKINGKLFLKGEENEYSVDYESLIKKGIELFSDCDCARDPYGPCPIYVEPY